MKPHQVCLPPVHKGTPVKIPFSDVDSPRIYTPSIVEAVKVLLLSSAPLTKPKVRFDVSREAAFHNFSILKEANYDLDSILNVPGETSVTTYGSEFKSVKNLEQLFGKHHRWQMLKTRLVQGSNWPLVELDEKLRLRDLKGALVRGNHKSAGENESFLSEALVKEITKGWELILPLVKAPLVPGLIMSPMGVAEQLVIYPSQV